MTIKPTFTFLPDEHSAPHPTTNEPSVNDELLAEILRKQSRRELIRNIVHKVQLAEETNMGSSQGGTPPTTDALDSLPALPLFFSPVVMRNEMEAWQRNFFLKVTTEARRIAEQRIAEGWPDTLVTKGESLNEALSLITCNPFEAGYQAAIAKFAFETNQESLPVKKTPEDVPPIPREHIALNNAVGNRYWSASAEARDDLLLHSASPSYAELITGVELLESELSAAANIIKKLTEERTVLQRRIPELEAHQLANFQLRISLMSASKQLCSSEDVSSLPKKLKEAALWKSTDPVLFETYETITRRSAQMEARLVSIKALVTDPSGD